jgi:ABC-type Fe3+-hydroxamate transport system substrate-binding protein
MKNYRSVLYVVLILLLLWFTVGCGSATPVATSEPNLNGEVGYPSSGYPAPSNGGRLNLTSTRVAEVVAPQPDRATVTGIVISQRTNKPMVEVPVQLAGVFYEGDRGAFVLDTAQSPTTTTDGQGRFVFVDIDPQDYVVVIGNVEVNDYVIIPDESGRAKIFTAVSGEVLDTNLHTILLENWE